MVDLGRLAGFPAGCSSRRGDWGALFVSLGFFRVVSPYLVRVGTVVHAVFRRNFFDLQRINATSHFLAHRCVETHDFRNVSPLKF